MQRYAFLLKRHCYRQKKAKKELNNPKSTIAYRLSLVTYHLKYVPLQSDLGESLRIPARQCVNSGVFGRAQRFVNQCLMYPPAEGFVPSGTLVRLAAGS